MPLHVSATTWLTRAVAVALGLVIYVVLPVAAAGADVPYRHPAAAVDGGSEVPPGAMPVPARALTLVELTDIALQNNPSTRVAWAQIRAAAAALGIANSQYWPQVGATLSVSRSRRLSQTDASATGPLQTRYGPAISVSYLLWDFGTRAAGSNAAQFRLLGANLTRDQTLQDVILAVEQSYYQVQGYRALVQANEKTLENVEASLSAATKRRELGLSTVGDVYRAEAAVAQAHLVLEQTRANEAIARGNLAVAVGYAVNTSLDIEPWSEETHPKPPSRDVESLLADARATRPELLAAKAQEMAALANVRAVSSQGLPTVTLDANGSRTWVTGRSRSDSYSVGATLNIPIFTGFNDRYAKQQAQAEADQFQASNDVLVRQIEQQVWQAYQGVRAASDQLTSAETLLKSAALAAEVSQARYEKGLDSILDLLSAQATLADARASRIQTELNYYSALSALGHAVGGLANGRAAGRWQ